MNSNGIIDWMHLKTKSMRQEINFAAHLPIRKARNFPVQTSWGDILYANRDGVSHGNGDFLVCASINGQPNFSDIWVVNGKIFPNTYNIKNFTNIISNSTIKSETPRPKSILA